MGGWNVLNLEKKERERSINQQVAQTDPPRVTVS